MLPAARIGDLQQCSNPSHGGRPILLPGCPSVRVGGKFAARTHDWGFCNGLLPPAFPEPVAVIVTGARSVRIGGEYAARFGDETSHKGVIVQGEPTVRLGGETIRVPRTKDASDDFAIRVVVGVGVSANIRNSLEELIKRLRELEKLLKGLALDFVLLEVHDRVNDRYYVFAYFGLGLGVDAFANEVSPGAEISLGLPGPWNSFKTSQPIQAPELDGPARLTQAYAFHKAETEST